MDIVFQRLAGNRLDVISSFGEIAKKYRNIATTMLEWPYGRLPLLQNH